MALSPCDRGAQTADTKDTPVDPLGLRRDRTARRVERHSKNRTDRLEYSLERLVETRRTGRWLAPRPITRSPSMRNVINRQGCAGGFKNRCARFRDFCDNLRRPALHILIGARRQSQSRPRIRSPRAVNRLIGCAFLTARLSACGWPTRQTSSLARVTAVYNRFLCSIT